jgi:hypothetical protein
MLLAGNLLLWTFLLKLLPCTLCLCKRPWLGCPGLFSLLLLHTASSKQRQSHQARQPLKNSS